MNQPPENPYSSPETDPLPLVPAEREDAQAEEPADHPSGKEMYNLVTDVAVGVNVRWRDNVFQLVCIVVSTILFAAVGGLFYGVEGLVIGFAAGVLVGLLGSGIYLMIYRGLRHLRGKHD